jgi:hypothetical protein
VLIEPTRRWFRLDLPPEWSPQGTDLWKSPSGALFQVLEIFRTTSPIDPDTLVELHEDWCEESDLHAHETRIEQLPSGILMVRSYGETRSDEFVMAGHFSWGGRLARLSFRTRMERLRDEDLAEVLAAFLDLQPSENAS